jgi:hypothetical protein
MLLEARPELVGRIPDNRPAASATKPDGQLDPNASRVDF